MGRFIIDGNQVYEMDEECLRKKSRAETKTKIKQEHIDKRQQKSKDKEQ